MPRLTGAALALVAPIAAAHPLATPAPPGWNFEPWVLACMVVAALLYAAGITRLWRRAGRGRGVAAWRVAAFAAGWLVVGIALVSPLDPLGTQLFSAHMLQHELLMALAAPLLVIARPLGAWAWAWPAGGRLLRAPAWRRVWGRLCQPAAAWVLHALALWLWHVPALFEAALAHAGVHTLQHLSFVGSALLYWWSVLRPAPRAASGAALASLFTTMAHTGALGALLTLAGTPWYASYELTAPAWGFTALEDQQLGGLLMWVPAGFAYFVAGLVAAARWGGLVLRAPRGSALSAGAVRPCPRTVSTPPSP